MTDKKLSFEEAYLSLEKIAEKLGGSDIPLEEAIKLYEEGIKLSQQCTDALASAKQKIELLQNEANLND